MTVKLRPIQSKVNSPLKITELFQFQNPVFLAVSMAVARCCNGWNLKTSSSRNARRTGLETSSETQYTRDIIIWILKIILSVEISILWYKLATWLQSSYYTISQQSNMHGKGIARNCQTAYVELGGMRNKVDA